MAVAAVVPTAVSELSISDAVSFSCAPTSVETDSEGFLRGAGAGLNGLAGIDHEMRRANARRPRHGS